MPEAVKERRRGRRRKSFAPQASIRRRKGFDGNAMETVMKTSNRRVRGVLVAIVPTFCLALGAAESRAAFCEPKTSSDAAELRTVELAIEVFENSHTNMDWKVESGAFHDALSKVQAMKSDSLRTQMALRMVDALTVVRTNNWEGEWFRLHIRIENFDTLLAFVFKDMQLAPDKYIVPIWGSRVKMLKSLKDELSIYADAVDPNAGMGNSSGKIPIIQGPKSMDEFAAWRRERRRMWLEEQKKKEPLEKRWSYARELKREIAEFEHLHFEQRARVLRRNCGKLPPSQQEALIKEIEAALGHKVKWDAGPE